MFNKFSYVKPLKQVSLYILDDASSLILRLINHWKATNNLKTNLLSEQSAMPSQTRTSVMQTPLAHLNSNALHLVSRFVTVLAESKQANK